MTSLLTDAQWEKIHIFLYNHPLLPMVFGLVITWIYAAML